MLLHAGYGNVQSWIKRWRARHEISLKTVFGESLSVPEFGPRLELAQNLCTEFPVHNVLNADETALFYRMQSSKTFTLKTEKQVFGKKVDITRETLLVACSAVGEKRPLLCLGKAKKRSLDQSFRKASNCSCAL